MDLELPTLSSEVQGIDYFNRDHWLTSIQVKWSLAARRKMFQLWKEYVSTHNLPTRTILDVGATPDTERGDSNCMIPWLLETNTLLSLYSPENINSLKNLYPKINILPPSASSELPASARSFDWTISSATLEHVGSKAQQEHFLLELGRVSSGGIFLTTPNRFHWLEFHTKLPLFHWLPRALYKTLLQIMNLDFWSKEENLRLVGKRELLKMAKKTLGEEFKVEIKTVWSLGMPSNLILLAMRNA